MRYAIRSLRGSPALAAIAIASLAFGIGANLTVYSVVRELFWTMSVPEGWTGSSGWTRI